MDNIDMMNQKNVMSKPPGSKSRMNLVYETKEEFVITIDFELIG